MNVSVRRPTLVEILLQPSNGKRVAWWNAWLSLSFRKRDHADFAMPKLRLPPSLNAHILQYIFKEVVILFDGFSSPQELDRFYPVFKVYDVDEGVSVFPIVGLPYHRQCLGKIGRMCWDNTMITFYGRFHAEDVILAKDLNLYERRILELVCYQIFFEKNETNANTFRCTMHTYASYLAAEKTSLKDYIKEIATVNIGGESVPDPKHHDYMVKLVLFLGGYRGYFVEVYEVAKELNLCKYMEYCSWGRYSREKNSA